MKAIPTKYNGIQYRSRLEARWAVFFDSLNIWAQYEPFEIFNESRSKSYLPDFWLGVIGFEQEYLIEVKPITPNDDYLNYLKSIYDPNLAKPAPILIVVGEPSFIQPDGFYITKGGIRKGFAFLRCDRCGLYRFIVDISDYPTDTHHCRASEERSHDKAVQIAAEFRFDL